MYAKVGKKINLLVLVSALPSVEIVHSPLLQTIKDKNAFLITS